MEPGIPASLGEAIASEPGWLRAWVFLLVATHFAALAFVVGRAQGGWIFRAEALAIFVSFVAAGALMTWLYGEYGYVRLLGLAHLVFWTPVYAWVLARRRAIGTDSVFGKYVVAYLVIAGISLVIDAVDLVRHLLGDGELWQRWS